MDRVADHRGFGIAEELCVHEIACCWNEDEQTAREHPGKRQRHHDLAECRRRRRIQIHRGIDQTNVDLFETHVDRQNHERQKVVGEAADDRRRGVQQLAVVHDVQPLEHTREVKRAHHTGHRTLVGEDVAPGEGSNEIRREERNHDQTEQDVSVLATPKSNDVRERITDGDREDRRNTRIGETADELRPKIGERGAVVTPVPRERREEVEAPVLCRQ